MKNVIEITENADKNSLVLIDELGGGTDPDEGQAIAKAVISYLLSLKCKGIITIALFISQRIRLFHRRD